MKRVVRWKPRLAMLLLASCAPVHSGPTTVESKRKPRDANPASAEELSESMIRFSTSATEVLSDDEAKTPASNSYSHQRLLGRRKRLGEPQVQLEATEMHSAFASTDCSGWLSFVLNTVSPLHEAVLQSQRRLKEHNHAYSEDFSLRERLRPWPRAFVVTQFLRTEYADATGFDSVDNFEDLRAGDIGAYAMGRYSKPTDESRPKPRDTGHVFVVLGPPSVVDPETEDYDGRGTLSEEAAKVIAVPVADSTSVVHFDPDSRTDDKGRYTLPKVRPHPRAKAGGVGTGTIWFALSKEGRVLQRRLGPQQKYRPVLARAARLGGSISLDDVVLDATGALLVRVFDNAPSVFHGSPYGDAPIRLTGDGGLRLASGRVVLNGQSDFSGGVTVEDAELIVASSTGLGTGEVTIRGGSMTLLEPAIADTALVTVAGDLPEGALRLDYKGKNVVRALRIGNKTHRCGTWGSPDSGAMFTDPVFSGKGVLELTAQPLEACTPQPEPPPQKRSPRKSSKLRASR